MADKVNPMDILTLDDFLKVEDAWNDLVLSSDYPLPFMSHTWIRVWWRYFGKGLGFCCLVVRDNSRFLAGIPLAIRRINFKGICLQVAEIVGTGPVPTRGMGLSDKTGLVVRKNQPDSGRYLREMMIKFHDRIDGYDLKGIYIRKPELSLVNSLSDRLIRASERSISPYLPLPETWENFLGSRTRNFRKQMKRKQRILKQEGLSEIAYYASDDDYDQWLAEVISISNRSWKVSHGTNLYRHPLLKKFYHDLFFEMAQKRWICLGLMRLNHVGIAYELCFDFGNRLFSYNSNYDRAAAKLSPGTILTAAIIERACGEKRSEYDFLRGNEAYKSYWCKNFRKESRLLIFKPGFKSRYYFALGPELKRRLKSVALIRKINDRVSGLRNRILHP